MYHGVRNIVLILVYFRIRQEFIDSVIMYLIKPSNPFYMTESVDDLSQGLHAAKEMTGKNQSWLRPQAEKIRIDFEKLPEVAKSALLHGICMRYFEEKGLSHLKPAVRTIIFSGETFKVSINSPVVGRELQHYSSELIQLFSDRV